MLLSNIIFKVDTKNQSLGILVFFAFLSSINNPEITYLDSMSLTMDLPSKKIDT